MRKGAWPTVSASGARNPLQKRVMVTGCILLAAMIGVSAAAFADPPSPSKSRVDAALQNILTLERPGQDGYATFWDGNKYIQCGRTPERGLRCEAAGTLMQPSLERVLTPERVGRLAALGWRFEPNFGNYVQIFPPGVATSLVADKILQALAEGYDAQLADLEVRTAWVRSEPCPPRNGPSQNLAGMINNAPAMAATAVHACAYKPPTDLGPSLAATSSAQLFEFYGVRVSSEIQRLRVNVDRKVFVIFEAGIGYIQCQPQQSPSQIYCEAQSAESWEALAGILTPERVAQLHAAGFADPGRSPNYWKNYSLDKFDDAAIARELLTVLHDVYGYNGLPKLKVLTEDSRR
jgi:hypothetical protein